LSPILLKQPSDMKGGRSLLTPLTAIWPARPPHFALVGRFPRPVPIYPEFMIAASFLQVYGQMVTSPCSLFSQRRTVVGFQNELSTALSIKPVV
jgi:hypothetical protein